MSDTLTSLRRKIDSAGDLQSVVRTMKALAASSIGQYERSTAALSDYALTVELGLSVCLRRAELQGQRAEQQQPAAVDVVNAVVFGSDQGLVGMFNEAVADHALATLAELPGKARVWAVGERVLARLADAGLELAGVFAVPGSVEAIAPLVGQILVQSEASVKPGEATELHLFYNRPASESGYAPVAHRLLPLDRAWWRELAEYPWPTKNLPEVLGSSQTLRALIREHLFISLFRACAESLASENASRLTAMERADKNIDELLDGLNNSFHRLRQSNIDEELFDVIAGYEALAKE